MLNYQSDKSIGTVCLCFITAVVLLSPSPAFSVVTEFSPVLSVSENYTDNYDQTEKDKQEEWYTTYEARFLMSMREKTWRAYFIYKPQYKDYREHDEDDTLEHNFSLYGDMDLSRHANIDYRFVYDDYEEGNESESSESIAHVGGTFELDKYKSLALSQTYSRLYNRIQRTGDFEEHDTNDTSVDYFHRFGRRNSWGTGFTYAFDEYDDPNADENESYNPTGFLAYWFNVRYGFDTNVSYEKTDFDLTGNEEDVWSGNVRFIRKFTRHFQTYLKYAHSYSEDDMEKHTVYNPSVGFDWNVSETSNISVGVGVLFNEYENQDDSEDAFVELDVFKLFDFSPRGDFYVSASSGYEESGDDAASLGFTIYYQAGANFTYALTRRSDLDISTAYKRNEYDEVQSDRVDNTFDVNAGLNWRPLRWMTVRMSYSYTDFDTDGAGREDYEENKGMIKVSISPWKPIRMKPADPTPAQTREAVETKIFDDR
ncbi:MAG: outer membrane beta-barrel protein [Thermodesulfobacteriota bacterium]